jgi:hypothetical protein
VSQNGSISAAEWCSKCGNLCVKVYTNKGASSLCCHADVLVRRPALKAKENQVGGDHYKHFPISPFEYAMANNLNAYQFSVIKYVTRYPFKGGIEDLRKCLDVLERLIKHEESK